MKLIEETWKTGTAYEVLLVADNVGKADAAAMYSGKDVDGMNDAHTFAPMSVLYVVDPAAAHKFYVADESGRFVGQ